jgi:hypothetical protein
MRGPYNDSSVYRYEENMRMDDTQYENLKKKYFNFLLSISSFIRITVDYIIKGLKIFFSIFNVSTGDDMVQTYPLGM